MDSNLTPPGGDTSPAGERERENFQNQAGATAEAVFAAEKTGFTFARKGFNL